MNNLKLYDIIYSVQRFIGDNTGARVDAIYDAYKYPTAKPFFTIGVLTYERRYGVKQREAVQVIEHIQLGYHAEYYADRSNMSDEVADLLTFNKVPLYSTENPTEVIGEFSVEVSAVVPMPAGEMARESEYHRVYFDLEIENIKRGNR